MQTAIQQQLILDHLSTSDLKKRLGRLDSAYHITDDRHTRQSMLLLMDEIKLELIRRGKYGRTCKQNRTVAS